MKSVTRQLLLLIELFTLMTSSENAQTTLTTLLLTAAPSNNDTGQPYKDWVFINYTFKRFEGLTQRGIPTAKEALSQK